jgi:hypothetical protein
VFEGIIPFFAPKCELPAFLFDSLSRNLLVVVSVWMREFCQAENDLFVLFLSAASSRNVFVVKLSGLLCA